MSFTSNPGRKAIEEMIWMHVSHLDHGKKEEATLEVTIIMEVVMDLVVIILDRMVVQMCVLHPDHGKKE